MAKAALSSGPRLAYEQPMRMYREILASTDARLALEQFLLSSGLFARGLLSRP